MGTQEFFFVPRSRQNFLYFFTELKTYHLSYFHLYISFSCNFILTIKPLGKPLSKTGGGSCSLDPSILNIFPIVTGDNSPYIYWPAGFALIPTRASPEKQGPSTLKSSFPWQSCPISRRPLKVNSVGIPVASEIVRLKKINEERC